MRMVKRTQNYWIEEGRTERETLYYVAKNKLGRLFLPSIIGKYWAKNEERTYFMFQQDPHNGDLDGSVEKEGRTNERKNNLGRPRARQKPNEGNVQKAKGIYLKMYPGMASVAIIYL